MCEINNSIENNRSYPFFRNAKSYFPEITMFTSYSSWFQEYAHNLSNISKQDNFIGYHPISDVFYLKGNGRDIFLSSNVFYFLDEKDIYIGKFLRALNFFLHITHSNALLHLNIEAKEFSFFLKEYSKKVQYYINLNSEYIECRSFEYIYKNEILRDLNEIIRPLIDVTVKDIDELSSGDMALFEILTV